MIFFEKQIVTEKFIVNQKYEPGTFIPTLHRINITHHIGVVNGSNWNLNIKTHVLFVSKKEIENIVEASFQKEIDIDLWEHKKKLDFDYIFSCVVGMAVDVENYLKDNVQLHILETSPLIPYYEIREAAENIFSELL
jgi:hypothetical protein